MVEKIRANNGRQVGRTDFCIGHGGGNRCTAVDCNKGARGSSGFCIAHGGGKKCTMENCRNGAGRSDLCSKHGGGNTYDAPSSTRRKAWRRSLSHRRRVIALLRCQEPGCTTKAIGSREKCAVHSARLNP
jgi:hypothetical protein